MNEFISVYVTYKNELCQRWAKSTTQHVVDPHINGYATPTTFTHHPALAICLHVALIAHPPIAPPATRAHCPRVQT